MDNFTVGVVVFPGSNCDRDVSWALEGCLDIEQNTCGMSLQI